jgi:LPS-assembly protein
MNAIAATLLLFFTLCAPTAFAQSSVTDGVLINADNMFRDLEKKTVLLKGNVQVVFQGQHLSCDQAQLDMKKEQITAEGHVILSNERVHVEGDRLVFNYKQNTGLIYNGFVQSGQVVFEGDVVEKVGEDHYLANNAFYTACETCPPGWSFSGRKIDAQLGGYARIQRPVFRIGGVPILILPGLIVPLKSSRQSGLLVPSMDYSKKGGFALSAIYFWAINRSQDLTLTAKWYRLRGYKMHGDYRYVLSPDSQGRLQTAWMTDRALKEEYNFHSDVDRWFVNYDHIYEMPEDYVHRADLRLVSDLRYTRDFPEELVGHGDPALENKTSITKANDDNYFSAEADLYTNLLRHYPLASNEDAVHRMPEIRYSLKEQPIANTGLMINMNLDYVNFARGTYSYDDLQACVDGSTAKCSGAYSVMPEGISNLDQELSLGKIQHNGVFNRATDLQRTGQRLDIQPTLSYPFQIGRRLDLLPSVTYRETQYRFDPPIGDDGAPAFNPTAARRYLQTDFWARTEFSRIFGNLQDEKSRRWKHSIEPEVGYSQIPIMRKPNHPFFGTFEGQQYLRQFEPLSDADLGNDRTGVQFDYYDRTYEKRVVNFALNNTLTEKLWKNGDSSYQTFMRFNVGQSYDFTEAQRSDHSHPWSAIYGLLDMRLDHFETYTTMSYNPYAHKTNTSARVRGMLTPQNFLQLSYTQNFILDETDYHLVANGETRNVGIGGGLAVRYLEAVGEVDFSDITHKVQSWSYGLRIRPPGNCWLIQIEHVQVLGGDAKIHASLNFDFGGDRVVAQK